MSSSSRAAVGSSTSPSALIEETSANKAEYSSRWAALRGEAWCFRGLRRPGVSLGAGLLCFPVRSCFGGWFVNGLVWSALVWRAPSTAPGSRGATRGAAGGGVVADPLLLGWG